MHTKEAHKLKQCVLNEYASLSTQEMLKEILVTTSNSFIISHNMHAIVEQTELTSIYMFASEID